MKIYSISFFLLLLVALAACSDQKATNTVTNKNAPPEVKKGVAPVADAEAALIEMENGAAFGTIKLELYSNIAPKMVARFKELAREGYYNGIAFHRINPQVIQAGDATTKPGAVRTSPRGGDSGKPNVDAEFSDIPYDIGILGAARTQEFHTANSQFFITLQRYPGFDNRYTVFGKVVEGMNNVRTIASVPKEGERPVEPVRIKSVTIVPR